jgi:multiple sugar transport system permease protein
MLNKIAKFRRFFSVLIYIPLVIAPVAVGLFMKWMFVSDFGTINYLLGLVRLPTPAWLGDSRFAIWSLILSDAWQWTPFVTLVLLAGLRSLPTEPVEAAKIDGASGLRTIWSITLPGLKPIILFVLVIRSTNAVRMFDKVYVMTGGGPGNSTETLMHYNYRVAFGRLEFGRAAAVSVWALLFLMILAAILIYLLFQRESEA